MRITVLGGFAGMSGEGHGCSGYLVRHGGTSLVADLGPGTLARLRQEADVRELDGVVISHGHLDHIVDLAGLFHLLRYAPTRPTRPIPLFLPPGTGPQFASWRLALMGAQGDPLLDEAFDVQEYDPNTTLTIGEVTVSFRRTVHPLPCWAMRFAARGSGAIGYTADTGPTADLIPLLDGVDVLISEATLIEAEPGEPLESRGHLTAEEAGELAARAGAGTLVLAHRWEEADPSGLIDRAGRAFGGRIEVATPGLTVHAADLTG